MKYVLFIAIVIIDLIYITPVEILAVLFSKRLFSIISNSVSEIEITPMLYKAVLFLNEQFCIRVEFDFWMLRTPDSLKARLLKN